MLYALFKLLRAHKKGKLKDGMGEFATEQAGELLLAPFWLAIFIISPFFIISAIFAFFELWGGPYGIAKFFFWFFAVIITLIAFIMEAIASRTKKMVKRVSERVTKSRILD